MILLAAFVGEAHGQSPFDAPSPQVLTEARSIVQSMRENPRGPYLRLRWFCNDGTVQPPAALACAERGGGRQHGEYSPERARLAELGWSVGTVFTALSWDELWDADRRHQRLRELSLERYLTDIDDGWVLRLAQDYRGRVQIEDEEAYGRALLLRLLADRDWVAANYLLLRESVRVIPHRGSGEDRTRTVRRDAIDLAQRDPSFERLRVEIHTRPTSATADRVRSWARNKPEAIREAAARIAGGLDTLYGTAGRRARLAEQRAVLAADATTAGLAAFLGFSPEESPRARVVSLSGFLRESRRQILAPQTSAAYRLLLFDVIAEVESEHAVTAAEVLADEFLTRGELLELARRFVDAAYGTGVLTVGEFAELNANWPDPDATSLALQDYGRWLAYLRRLPQWSAGSVRYAFAEPLVRYSALDPRAAAFVDDVLRSSPLVGLADIARRLARDFGVLTGVTQTIDRRTVVGAFGLNPGVATGRLRVFETYEALESAQLERTDIVVLPETVAELAPVAGILTLGEGSPLSHVQLLARNFGIPNIAIVPDLLPAVRRLEGSEVFAAVASDGSFVVAPAADLDQTLLDAVLPANQTGAELTVPRPDLSLRQPIPLAELESSLSGRVVGPKAANLGQLARLFPGRVARAVAIPFGVFAEHLEAGEPSLRSRLVDAYAARRAGEVTEAELASLLAGIRQGVAELTLSTERRAALVEAMQNEFGTESDYGLFLRSDTNVEDLPQFTGAGLSETLPNVIGTDRQLALVPRIWASVLSPRAIAWRSNLMSNPEEVYASVLLMLAVPSTKSGVLVTSDLTGSGTGLTVSTGWGVGGAVAGEAVETMVLRSDGSEAVVSEAKTAYQRRLGAAGGIEWRPAPDGPVLTAEDKTALRALAREVGERYAPVYDENGAQRPWDIEFGFVDSELTLFQIRPLVQRGPQLADRLVAELTPQSAQASPTEISLAEFPLSAPN